MFSHSNALKKQESSGWLGREPYPVNSNIKLLYPQVYVWHTRTELPDLKDEERLKKLGKNTDEGIEI